MYTEEGELNVNFLLVLLYDADFDPESGLAGSLVALQSMARQSGFGVTIL